MTARPEIPSSGDLATCLRSVAAQAARLANGFALVFAADDPAGSPPRLRSAAGFATPESARAAAGVVLPLVRRAIDTGQTQSGPAIEALEGATGSLALPLAFEGRLHGVLALAAPDLDEAAETQAPLVELLALRLDHAHQCERLESLRASISVNEQLAEDKSEEILKLSEALFAQDIELLRSNEKLGKIEKLKNDFIEKMSRELRTPLNSIIESIISVLAGDHEALTDTSKQSLRAALDEGTSFLRTLQNILDLWRIKQGEMPVELADVNLREVVEEAIFSVQDALGDRPLTIENHLDEGFPKLRTDLAKISQILFLMLDNAVKFTPSGRIDIRARLESDWLECSVEDTGIGICPDDRQFIFDEFFQVDELSSTKYRGAGLGLALLRDLLVLLEGEIRVDSEAGKGSSFTVRLPIVPAG